MIDFPIDTLIFFHLLNPYIVPLIVLRIILPKQNQKKILPQMLLNYIDFELLYYLMVFDQMAEMYHYVVGLPLLQLQLLMQIELLSKLNS